MFFISDEVRPNLMEVGGSLESEKKRDLKKEGSMAWRF